MFKKASARLAKDLQCHRLYPAAGFNAQSFLHQHHVEQLMCESWVWRSYSLEVLWEACPVWIRGKGLPILGLLGQYLKTENILQSLQPCAPRSSLKETPHPLHDAWCSSTATWSDWAENSSFLSSDGGMQMAFGRGRAGTETCQMKTEREWKYKDNFPPNKNFEPNISISLIQQIEVTYCSQKWICNLYAFTEIERLKSSIIL